ncbi:MAG: endonuclease/exonuclease/phosphatase family protein [Pirellulales bacterium]|nr:endonuclease/exonuclease/phosphatase family protein [Pirellulales bacterium]
MINRLVLWKRRWRRKFSRTRWVARLLNRDVSAPHSSEPGLIILQLDGLSRKQFARALANGKMPSLHRLLRRGQFEELTFYSGLPSTTPAVQAEVMYGAPTAVPAFQFLHRQSGKTRLMYEVEAARCVSRRLAAEHQPLLEGGRSYSNIYAAGADEARLCAETMDLKSLRQMAKPWKLAVVLCLYFTTILRVAALALLEAFIAAGDMIVGLVGKQHWRAELQSITSRVLVSIAMREWLRVMVKLSIAEGAPIVYANFLGYDEQAHRRGPDSRFAHWVLKGIDDVVGDLFRTARKSDARDYEVVVFSDHGQEHTQIYELVHGCTIQEAASRAFDRGPLAGRRILGLDNYGHRGPETDERARRLLRIRRGRVEPAQASEEELRNDIIVTALGPLGHIYLPVDAADDEKDQYAQALVENERTPLVLYVKSSGDLEARTRRGLFRIPEAADVVFGPDHPLRDVAAADLVRLCRHPDAGDLVISGWSPGERPMTFVQENGAHGSIGSEETRGFALVPHGLDVRRRRSTSGEAFIRGRDLYEAAWRFVHPERPQAIGEEKPTLDEPTHAEDDRRTAAQSNGAATGPALRVMTYNIHSCIGIDGKVRPERIVAVIKSCGADVIALQEVDAYRRRSRSHAQAEFIAQALAMSHHYYAVSDWGGEQYGLAIISRFPLEHVQSGHLTAADPQRRREARGALWVRIETPGGPVHVVNTHFGLAREERRRQTEILLGVDWLGGIPADEPVVLCGDMNAGPKSPVCRSLAGRLLDAQTCVKNFRPRATFISTLPLRRLDHVFVSRQFSIRSVTLPRHPTAEVASDHLPVCVELTLKGK